MLTLFKIFWAKSSPHHKIVKGIRVNVRFIKGSFKEMISKVFARLLFIFSLKIG